MEVKVKVISNEKIKPSSPTPSHLKTFKLSYLDQLQPLDFYVPINFFYKQPSIRSSNPTTTTTLVDKLKVSLSETLTKFYPLAARISKDDNISIECNDEGALFIHVELSCNMSEFLEQPINHYLLYSGVGAPTDTDVDADDCGVQIAVRLNVFACGGICIGMRFSHKLFDGATISAFLKYWGAVATNATTSNSVIDEDVLRVASQLFPPDETHKSAEKSLPPPKYMKKRVWERFVFDAKAISTLKSIFTQDNQNQNPPPSSVIVVSSFIMKHVIAAGTATSTDTNIDTDTAASQKQYLLSISANMRPRMDPPLSQNSIGNMVWSIGILAPLITCNKDETMKRLVVQQREGIAKINGDFLKRFQGEGGHDFMKKVNLENLRMAFRRGVEVEMCFVTSWCRFGFNEFDFGWGKPLWYCNDARVPALGIPNNFLFIDTPSGDGIEAQLMLSEAEMNRLQLDQDFLALASISPPFLP